MTTFLATTKMVFRAEGRDDEARYIAQNFPMTPATFLTRWAGASGTELANAQSFVGELAELLGFPRPDPAQEDTRDNAYVFERRVIFRHGDGSQSEGRIDCYKRAYFVLEAKKLKVQSAPQVGAGETALGLPNFSG